MIKLFDEFPFVLKVMEAHPELGLDGWGNATRQYGLDYLSDLYPEKLAQAEAEAEEAFAVYENASWYFDNNFTARWNWLKAELDGEALYYIPDEIKGTFAEYGIEWQPVAADIASVEGEGGYYLNCDGIALSLSEEERAQYEERGEWMFEMYASRLPATIRISPDEQIEVTTEAELRAAINEMIASQISERETELAAYGATYFDGATLQVDPDENSLFQISFTKTDPEGGDSTVFYPFYEKRGGSALISTEQIWSCISAYQWSWVDEETAFVTVTTGLGEEIAQIDASVSAEVTAEPQVGVAGEKLATATATVDGTVLTATKTFAIPALEEPEVPVEPENPDTPDEPEVPVEPEGPAEPMGEGGKIHGDSCFCYDYQGGGIMANLVRFFCAIYHFFLNLRASLGV